MSFDKLTDRELYIKSIFLPLQKSEKKFYLDESNVNKIVEKISKIGNNYGFIGDKENLNKEKSSKRSHKYDVWIAKEVKKDLGLLSKIKEFKLILDWAVHEKINIFLYTFENAFIEQEKWHKNLYKKHDIKEIDIKEIDKERIIFRCSDKNHFLYILDENDLKYEGNMMGSCVGKGNYNSKIRNERSIIVSLRDKNNAPHATIEIDIKENTILQQFGKQNQSISEKYQKLIDEFVFYFTNYEFTEQKDIVWLLNIISNN